MLNFPGYKVFRKIYESDRSLVYRGVRSADGQPAIFKMLKIDVIPDVELIIGKQPAVPELKKNEAQNHFNLVFI